MIRVAIVEDEPSTAEILRGYVERFQKETGHKFRISLFSDGVDFISDYTAQYDIVCMDIEMPHLSGLDTARKLRLLDTEVLLLFITNMAQYAIQGYEVDAMDFMVKPVGYFNFSVKLSKAVRLLEKRSAAAIYLPLEVGAKKLVLSDIYYLEAVGHTVYFHTEGGVFEKRSSLLEMEDLLDPTRFVRCNKCYLVNLEHLTEIRQFTAIVEGEELQISRSRKKELLNAMAAYLRGEK